MKTFIHHDIEPILQDNTSSSRTYIVENSRYPSITTVTSFYTAADIAQWRRKVGNEEANKISRRASNRGTAFHNLCESYLKSEQQEISIFDQEIFQSIIPILDKIDYIHFLETKIYSHNLKVAGTVDCVAMYEDKLRVIDFKTSAKEKKREYIYNYFMQAAAYSFCIWELTGLVIPDLMIMVAVENNKPQIFHEKINPWLGNFKQIRQQFKQVKGY